MRVAWAYITTAALLMACTKDNVETSPVYYPPAQGGGGGPVEIGTFVGTFMTRSSWPGGPDISDPDTSIFADTVNVTVAMDTSMRELQFTIHDRTYTGSWDAGSNDVDWGSGIALFYDGAVVDSIRFQHSEGSSGTVFHHTFRGTKLP